MVAYEFYWPDPVKEYDLLGILLERRKDPRRITEASVMKWAWFRLFCEDFCP